MLIKIIHETTFLYPTELDNTEVRLPECLSWPTKSDKKAPITTKKDTKDSTSRKPKQQQQKQQKQPSEEDNLKRKQEYLDIVKSFLASPNSTYSFPPNLNSFERRLIHQICEELDLDHSSEGDGKERHIVIKKRPSNKQITEHEDKEEQEVEEEKECLTAEQEERARVEAMIAEFLESPEESLRLPSKMSAFERSVVHGVCDELGLMHQSEGKGKRRHIVIQKQNKSIQEGTKEREDKKTADNERSQHKKTKGGDRNSIMDEEADIGPPLPHDTETVPSSPKDKDSNIQGGAIPKTTQENNVTTIKKVRTRFIDGRYVDVEEGVNAAPQTKTCPVCGKDVPLPNYGLHSVQCERRSRETQQESSAPARSVS